MKKAAEISKMALIFVLLALLVCLSIYYINLFGGGGGYTFTTQMDYSVREQLYKASYVGLLDETLVSPYFIGACTPGARRGYIVSAAAIYGGEISNIVSALVSPDASFSKTDSPLPVTEGVSFLYIRFRTELPRSLIYYSQNEGSVMTSVGDEYVFDMFVFPQDRGVSAYMRDLRGNAYVSSTEAAHINENRIVSYTESGGDFDFEFARLSPADSAMISAGYYDKTDAFEIIPTGTVSAPSAVVSGKESIDKTAAEAILRVFGLNPEKISAYEGDDGVTYFDEGINVKMGKDGYVSYSALSGQYGIGISDVIGYDFDEGDYTVTDCVGAALVFGEKLGIFDSGAFDVAVTCCEAGGGSASISLSYVYGGLSVVSDGRSALEIEIGGGKITAVRFIRLKGQAYDGESSIFDMNWRIRAELATSKSPFGLEFVQYEQGGRLYLTLVSRSVDGGEK